MNLAAPTAYAVLVWWFTTGLILYLDRLPQRTFRGSLGAGAVFAAVAVLKLRASAADASAIGAYTGFTAAIVLWGWLEMSFLMGVVTGPRRRGCDPGCRGWRHFRHAVAAILYNELATLAAAGAVWWLTAGQPNRSAAWTFGALWAMRLSAKLNLFLGVPNSGEQFLPDHLRYLASYFRRRRMNPLFPLSVGAAAAAVILLLRLKSGADDAYHATAYALTASLVALGLVEHAFMVLPVPSERLWIWALRADAAVTARDPPPPCLPPTSRT